MGLFTLRRFPTMVLRRLGFNARSMKVPYGRLFSFRDLRQRGFSPSTILDIGAAQGHWTRACLTVYPQARYFLCDALTENEPLLSALRTEHGNIDFMIAAAGNQ